MEDKKLDNEAEVYQPVKKNEFDEAYLYSNAQVYGCARIVPPEERNKQSNI